MKRQSGSVERKDETGRVTGHGGCRTGERVNGGKRGWLDKWKELRKRKSKLSMTRHRSEVQKKAGAESSSGARHPGDAQRYLQGCKQAEVLLSVGSI